MADITNEPLKLETVSETLLKKRKVNEEKRRENLEKVKAQRETQRKQKTELRKTRFKRADEFLDEYSNIEKETSRIKRLRVRRTPKDAEIEQGKLMLVVRNDVKPKDHPRIANALKHLRITKEHTAAFVRVDDKTAIDLKDVAPYVNTGVPTLETVQNLIQKRGYTWIDNKPVAISSNTMVEDKLGEHGIICVEDIVHEIVNPGQHFDRVNRFLRPFRFTKTRGQRQRKLARLDDSKKGLDVNEMVAAMN